MFQQLLGNDESMLICDTSTIGQSLHQQTNQNLNHLVSSAAFLANDVNSELKMLFETTDPARPDDTNHLGLKNTSPSNYHAMNNNELLSSSRSSSGSFNNDNGKRAKNNNNSNNNVHSSINNNNRHQHVLDAFETLFDNDESHLMNCLEMNNVGTGTCSSNQTLFSSAQFKTNNNNNNSNDSVNNGHNNRLALIHHHPNSTNLHKHEKTSFEQNDDPDDMMNVSTHCDTFDNDHGIDFMDHEVMSTSDDFLFNLDTFDMFGEFDNLVDAEVDNDECHENNTNNTNDNSAKDFNMSADNSNSQITLNNQNNDNETIHNQHDEDLLNNDCDPEMEDLIPTSVREFWTNPSTEIGCGINKADFVGTLNNPMINGINKNKEYSNKNTNTDKVMKKCIQSSIRNAKCTNETDNQIGCNLVSGNY